MVASLNLSFCSILIQTQLVGHPGNKEIPTFDGAPDPKGIISEVRQGSRSEASKALQIPSRSAFGITGNAIAFLTARPEYLMTDEMLEFVCSLTGGYRSIYRWSV